MATNKTPAFDPFQQGVTARDFFAGGFVCAAIPVELIPLILSAMQNLTWPDVWMGDDEQVVQSMRQVSHWLSTLGNTSDECVSRGQCETCENGNGDECATCATMGGTASIYGELENFMACLDISGLIKIEDGHLWAMNACCEWVDLGAITDAITGDVVLPPDIDTDHTPVSRCGKASAAVETLWLVADACWNAVDLFPWDRMNYVTSRAPGLDLYKIEVHNAINQVFLITGIILLTSYGALDYDKEDVFPSDGKQRMKCFLEKHMDDTLSVDKDQIYTAIGLAIDDMITFADIAVRNFWHHVKAAIGKGDFANVATAGALDETVDCSCPGVPGSETDPTVSGWYLSKLDEWKVPWSGVYNTKFCLRHAAVHDMFGVMYYFEWQGNPNLKRMSCVDAECGVTDACAWGNTSDHLEYEAQGTIFVSGSSAGFNETLGAGNFISQASNYGDVSDPALPPYPQATLVGHGFFGDGFDTAGDYYKVFVRYLHNINSPSHQ